MEEKEPQHEPVLLSEDHREKKADPPYVMIALIIIALLMVGWKAYKRDDERTVMIESSKTALRKKLEYEMKQNKPREQPPR